MVVALEASSSVAFITEGHDALWTQVKNPEGYCFEVRQLLWVPGEPDLCFQNHADIQPIHLGRYNCKVMDQTMKAIKWD